MYNEVAGDVVLEVGGQKCLSVICALDDPSTGVSNGCHDILSQGSCVAPRPEEYEADGNLSTTSLRCRSSGEFASEAQTVYPSCPQVLGSDTLIQSGVGVNLSCGGPSIGDTCLVFCVEGYPAVSNDTSILTCAYNSSDNTARRENEVPLCLVVTRDVIASLTDFSECFSFNYNETCVVRCSLGHTGVEDKNTTELQGDRRSPPGLLGVSLELSTVRALAERVLPCDHHFVQTNGKIFLQWDGVAEDDDVNDDSLAFPWDPARACPLRVRQRPWESSMAPGRTVRRTRSSLGMTKAEPTALRFRQRASLPC